MQSGVKGNGDYFVEVLVFIEPAEEGMEGEEELNLFGLCVGPVSSVLAEDFEEGHRRLIIILQVLVNH